MVIKAYRDAVVSSPLDRSLMLKFKAVKGAIKEWRLKLITEESAAKFNLDGKTNDMYNMIRLQKLVLYDEKKLRLEWLKNLLEIEEVNIKDSKQEARVKWVKDGDENSSSFFSIDHLEVR